MQKLLLNKAKSPMLLRLCGAVSFYLTLEDITKLVLTCTENKQLKPFHCSPPLPFPFVSPQGALPSNLQVVREAVAFTWRFLHSGIIDLLPPSLVKCYSTTPLLLARLTRQIANKLWHLLLLSAPSPLATVLPQLNCLFESLLSRRYGKQERRQPKGCHYWECTTQLK